MFDIFRLKNKGDSTVSRLISISLVALISASIFGGCARQISSNVYSANAVGETSTTYPGVVISCRQVLVEDKEYLEQNGLGIIGGGVTGGYLGSKVGKGEGNMLATVGGAIVGATAGAYAEKMLKSQNAIEYVVALENGEAKTVTQGLDPSYSAGQKVWLIVSQRGRSRIVPRQSDQSYLGHPSPATPGTAS
jgi:outer membrane lipoprotein SlyB